MKIKGLIVILRICFPWQMFYSTDLLSIRGKGKLSRCWLAATVNERLFKKMYKAGAISGIDISITCDEIVKVLQTTSKRPYKRFSLYLSSQLMYGAVKILWYQTIIFQNFLFETKRKLERHVEIQRYTEGFEIREPPDILSVVQDYHNAHLDDNLHILEDESQGARLQMIMQDAACMNFGALTNEEMDLLLTHDGTISLEMLYRANARADTHRHVTSETIEEIEEQSREAMRHSVKEAISIEESGKGLTTPKRHGLGDSNMDTPKKKRRLTFEDKNEIMTEPMPSILLPEMEVEQPPTILESQLELESLHSSIMAAQRRQKMSKIKDKSTVLNRDIIRACFRDVTVYTRKSEPPVLMIPSAITLLTQPSMCTSSIRGKVWCDVLQKLFNDHIAGPCIRETDHGRSHEIIRVHDTISKSQDPLTEISSAIGTMALDQMEHSKTLEKTLSERAEKVPSIIEGMDMIEKIDDVSVGLHLPEITAMDVDTIQEEDIRSLPSTCLTKHELCALLEVLWHDADYIQFTDLISPNHYTKLDAAVSFLYLLGFHTERKIVLKQASPYSSIWIQKHMSCMHVSDM